VERVRGFFRSTRERVAALPGIEAVSWSSTLPFWNQPSRPIAVDDEEARAKSQRPAAILDTVDTGYFAAAGIPILDGRDFADSDDDHSRAVAIINQELAAKFWPGRPAVGRTFRFDGDAIVRQVVGIAKTSTYTTLGEKPQPCVYIPLRQNFTEGMNLYVRTKAAPESELSAVRTAIQSADPNIAISDVRTGPRLIAQALFAPGIAVKLLGSFGALGLALASLGLYGSMAYAAGRRRREIGVRMALGASRTDVLMLFMKEGMTLVLTGLAAGALSSLALGTALSRLLFGISPADPISLGSACAVLVAAAWVACYLPARGAARGNPIAALHES